MKWYYKVLGGHTHVRVFMNGGKCGDLCFRNEEFKAIQIRLLYRPVLFVPDSQTGESKELVEFIDETPKVK